MGRAVVAAAVLESREAEREESRVAAGRRTASRRRGGE
jgi:hypothetical protein